MTISVERLILRYAEAILLANQMEGWVGPTSAFEALTVRPYLTHQRAILAQRTFSTMLQLMSFASTLGASKTSGYDI